MYYFDEINIGDRRDFGSFTFTADAIKAFAVQFDPQPFHLDEEAGRNSLFGGLAASGWHIGSVCMKLLVADRQRQAEAAAARNEDFAVWGPSPGFRELKWIKPVRPGFVLKARSVCTGKRLMASREGVGIAQMKHEILNQDDELLMTMENAQFLAVRDPAKARAEMGR